MLILILILFSCHAHAMNNDTSAQDLDEWIEHLRPAPLSQQATPDTQALAPAIPARPQKRSAQSITQRTSQQKKACLERLSLQKVRCPMYIDGCSWACVHSKPTSAITHRIIRADCVQQLREHCIQTHFSIETVTRYVETEMEKTIKVNLDNCDSDNLDTLEKAFIGINQ